MERLGIGKLLLSVMLLLCAKSAVADLFTFTNIDVPGATSTTANGINNLGQIVGRYTDANGSYGFIDSGGVFTTLPPYFGPGSPAAYGINDQGQIVTDFGLLYSGGTYTRIGTGANFATLGINDNGQIVGDVPVSALPPLLVGFIDTGGTFAFIQYSDQVATVINGINDSGEFVGSVDAFFGFVQTNPSATSCTPPTCTVLDNSPYGINDAGLIVGAFGIYAGGTYIPINDPNAGAVGTSPRGINNSDEIVGYYTDANGVTHGFLATPTAPLVPEPRTLPVLFVCLLAVAIGLRRNSKRVRQE